MWVECEYMLPRNGSIIRNLQAALAIAVLAVALVMITNVPIEYPSDPTLSGVPVDLELVVPGALGVAVLVDTVSAGLGIRSVIITGIGIVTVLLAALSCYTLYTSTPGMFAGGLFTLSAGVLLALVVLGFRAVDTVSRRKGTGNV